VNLRPVSAISLRTDAEVRASEAAATATRKRLGKRPPLPLPPVPTSVGSKPAVARPTPKDRMPLNTRAGPAQPRPTLSGFFAVSRGRNPGVFESWADVKTSTGDGFHRPRWRRFRTRAEAERWMTAEAQAAEAGDARGGAATGGAGGGSKARAGAGSRGVKRERTATDDAPAEKAEAGKGARQPAAKKKKRGEVCGPHE